MIPYRSPLATAVPTDFGTRLEIMKAIHTLITQDERERLWQRQSEIAALRRESEAFAIVLNDLRRELEPRLRSYVIKYDPNQPRVPRGNPDGGQWTREGGFDFGFDTDDGDNKSDSQAQAVEERKRREEYEPNQPRGLGNPDSAQSAREGGDNFGSRTNDQDSSGNTHAQAVEERGDKTPTVRHPNIVAAARSRLSEVECDAQYEADIVICTMVRTPLCYSSAMERYAACLSGHPIPELHF